MNIPSDPRNIKHGLEIPTITYSDQPYIVKTDDGAWLCCITTGVGREGEPGQIVTTTRSTDQGKTWADPVFVEPAGGPEASWAVLLKTPGRPHLHLLHPQQRQPARREGRQPALRERPLHPGGQPGLFRLQIQR